jgi:hypothetical protein
MAYGKSLEPKEQRMMLLHTAKDGGPIRRAHPKIHGSKKDRKRAKALQNAVKMRVMDEALRDEPGRSNDKA